VQIEVVLFGMLRERLARESRGRLTIELPEGATIHDLLVKLDANVNLACILNGENERNFERPLKDGDKIQLVQPIGGG
jgi:sulfur carrier protein ThiS